MNNLASWGYSYNPQEYEYLENYKSLLSDTINTAKSNINLPTEKPLHVQIKDDKEKFYKSRQSFVEICNKKKGHVIVDNGYMRCAPSIKGQSDGGLISFPNQDNNNRNKFENVKEAIKAVEAINAEEEEKSKAKTTRKPRATRKTSTTTTKKSTSKK